MSTLLVIKGPSIGLRYDLGERARIGRAPDNEVLVADANVSRVHAEILRNRMAYTIYDRGSKNGILVNGEPVREKLLLRNDEIVVGNTVFLFNSELNIRNARFSNNSVYLYPAADETVAAAKNQSTLANLAGRDREAVDFILRLADIFSGPPAPFVPTVEKLMTQIKATFSADVALLLMRDGSNRELRPIIALPANVPVVVNRRLAATVIEEQTALLSSEPAWEAPTNEPTESPEAGAASVVSTLCAPIIQDSEAIGTIVVARKEADFYSLRDLGLLQAVARLTASSIQTAQLADRMAQVKIESERFETVASRSVVVNETMSNARKAAQSDVTILITGESGTGKEVLARFIHESSLRNAGPFVAINCGAIPGPLFESELFGYERGAFTGAARTTPGKIEAAQGGTLFLDEIGELDLSLQPKLLRFLQDKGFYRVGGAKVIDADVRIIAATNADLEAAVKSGEFREDLWYRLNVLRLHMPALRERREDIGSLMDNMVARCATRLGRKIFGANDAALALLQKYNWPGNIRELENAVERAVLLSKGRILTPADFSGIDEARKKLSAESETTGRRGVEPLSLVERRHIIYTLKKLNWNQARAAEALGLHRNTLRNKIIEYGIETDAASRNSGTGTQG